MTEYEDRLLDKKIQVFTKDNLFEGKFQGIKILGEWGGPYLILKVEEVGTTFIPESRVERIYLVDEPSIPGEDGEGSGDPGQSAD